MVKDSSITILIVDDHPMVREGLRSMLNAPGLHIVGEASDGHKAVRQVEALAPDIVLMDIRMPDMDGIEALQAIKSARSDTRVIIITTYPSTTYLLRALAAGAAGFVLKDISRDALLGTVRAVAAGAKQIRVDLRASDTDFNLIVQDWGRGFNPPDMLEDDQRLGLLGMYERAALLGGECQIESQPGQGARVWVRVPMR